MNITVNRSKDILGDLIFTITCKPSEAIPFDDTMMDLLDKMEGDVAAYAKADHRLTDEVLSSIRDHKQAAFNRIKNNMKADINNKLKPFYDRICQEIYNWIFDQQDEETQQWMLGYDGARTRFYFDNDVTPEHIVAEPEDDEDDDEPGESD